MSWRPAAIGAAIVVVAGFLVGVAIGGKTTVRTVTVAQAAGSTTRSGTTGSTSGTGTGTTTTQPSAPRPVQYLASTSEPNTSNLLRTDTPARVKIGRASYENSVAFEDIFFEDCAGSATVEYPVNSATATFSGTLGWTIDTDSSASVALEIHADAADGPRLYRHVFTGPQSVNIHVPLRQAVKAVFVFVAPGACSGRASADGEFAFGNARFVG